MAWEIRERGTRYYTRSVRLKGRVTRQYFGCGLAGELAAAEDARRRAERKAATQALRAERGRVEAANRPLVEFLRASDLLLQAALIKAGFYRHNRGEWRKRHERRESGSTGATSPKGR